MPGPSTALSTLAPALGAITFPPVPNLGIGNPTQDDNVIMENATMVLQASLAPATATVSLTSLVLYTYLNSALSTISIRYFKGASGIVSECGHNGA